jgi:hypothetical protein
MSKERIEFGTLTFWALPALIAAGWIIHISWMIGLAGSVIPALVTLLLFGGLSYHIWNTEWVTADSRWLIAPVLVILLANYLPWWDLVHVGITDAMYHLIQSNSYLGRLEFSPIHHGQDFLFRPPTVPGIYAIELLITGESGFVHWTPLLLVICTCWQLQHLSERWNGRFMSALIVSVFLMIPVIRYWGQLPYSDVPVAGMWICLVHSYLKSDSDSKMSGITLGCIAGLTFLTKYVFIYTIGISAWLFLIEKLSNRNRYFIYGWFLISGPFLLFHLIVQGDPLAALYPQTSFAIGSATETLGQHNSSTWWAHLDSQLTVFGILGCVIGFYHLFVRRKEDTRDILMLLSPLLFLHVFILDFGTERYHTPWLALALVLAAVGPPTSESTSTTVQINRKKGMGVVCVTLLLLIASTHLSTISNENETIEYQLEYRHELMYFHLDTVADIPGDAILLTGHDLPVILNLGIEAYRFGNFENPIVESISVMGATHIATSNWHPRYQWEKDVEALLGHGSIEPLSINILGERTGVLWEVNDSIGLDPAMYVSSAEGRFVGDLLVLNSNQSAVVNSDNLGISWIEVNYQNSEQSVLRVLTGDDGVLMGGCFDRYAPKGSSCSIENGYSLNAGEDTVIYAWFGLI